MGVTDPSALTDPFFLGTQKEDKLFLYQKAAKAILYRPSQNIIINVGPLIDDRTEAQKQSTQNE